MIDAQRGAHVKIILAWLKCQKWCSMNDLVDTMVCTRDAKCGSKTRMQQPAHPDCMCYPDCVQSGLQDNPGKKFDQIYHLDRIVRGDRNVARIVYTLGV